MSTIAVDFADPTARYRPLRSAPLNTDTYSLMFNPTPDPFAVESFNPNVLGQAQTAMNPLTSLSFGQGGMGQMPPTALNVPSLYGSNLADDMKPNAFGATVKPMEGSTPGFWNNYGGMITSGVSAAADLVGAYQGYKQLGLARDSLNFQKDAFNKEYEMSKRGINDQLEQRQRNRVGTNPSRNMPVEEYMKQYGV